MEYDKKVIFILIDALRSDYVTKEDSPFLYNFARSNTYYKRVSQKRSYCERAEIFSGLTPDESGYFTAIGYSPNSSPFKSLSFFLELLSFLDPILFKSKYLRGLRNKVITILARSKRVKMRPYSIPSKILKYFSLTEDKYDFRDEKAFPGKNNLLIDCKKKGINVFYDGFTALNFKTSLSDEQRLELIQENLTENFQFYPVYIGVLDKIAHLYGPESTQRRKKLQALDKRLSKLYQGIKIQFPKSKFIILGDHGMSDVQRHIDLGKEIKTIARAKNLKLGKDYVYFLDSTIVRIWYMTETAKTILPNVVINNPMFIENGEFIDEKIAKKERIPFPDRRYGDILWMANLGVLIFPDFFHRNEPYKGMHGYDVNHFSSKGTCLVESVDGETVEDIELRDVYTILKTELEIK